MAAQRVRISDFGQSIFWTLAGVVGVGTSIAGVNKRVKAQDERLELLRQRNQAAAEMRSQEAEVAALAAQVAAVEEELLRARGLRWAPVAAQLQRIIGQPPAS